MLTGGYPEPALTLVLEKFERQSEKKKVVRWEATSEYPTGTLIGEVSIAPVFDDTLHCIGLVGSVHDITERKRAEDQVRKSEAKYRNIFENVQDVYYEASIDGTILEVSPSIEIISKGQYHKDDLIGSRCTISMRRLANGRLFYQHSRSEEML